MNVKEEKSSDYVCTPFDYSVGTSIINQAKHVNLDPGLLYEAVIDLSAEGLFTATCINMAAGVLLEDLGLPNYFFENITKNYLISILASIANSIKIQDGEAILFGHIGEVNFDSTQDQEGDTYHIRIAPEDTRDDMEAFINPLITGHRREYYYCPESRNYTYIIRPETVKDHSEEEFDNSKFLFHLSGNFRATPKPTRRRYVKFLEESEKSASPLVKVYNLAETGETRFMFNSDFALPQLTVLRRIFEDHGLVLRRAYWEPYCGKAIAPSSICSLYALGELSRKEEDSIVASLSAFLAYNVTEITDFYSNGILTFNEMLFAGNAIDFTHYFIYKESVNQVDKEIMGSLENADQRDAFASRIQDSNKGTYSSSLIMNLARSNPDLLKYLYELFAQRFDPSVGSTLSDEDIEHKYAEYDKIISARFMDMVEGYDVFRFMFKIVSCTLKTNFYKQEKRSYAFRFDNRILDPLVFDQFVFGIFYVNGHYACGTHMRAADIARGGLRMIRVTPENYNSELDKAVLLNYALGPKAQRLKHKDICESGSKGVFVPRPSYAYNSMSCLFDYTEGIMDLVLGDPAIIDHYGKHEMIFFGPDEGTAPLMDAASYQTKARGYKYWRTITTGKSFGIPHDTYGLLENGDIFGLLEKGEEGTDLEINGKSVMLTKDMQKIYDVIGGKIEYSGMTTTCVMGAFRSLISYYGSNEADLNMMMTGGPDGDLGSNEIQCYKGEICLIIDGGSILFDPNGLNKEELMKISFMRHTSPRADSLAFPVEKLSSEGFMVPRLGKNIKLPDGTIIEDGAVFHRTFLTDANNRKYIEKANIQAFIPCGGFKDTINHKNVKNFLKLFGELKFIVEGANVFFNDAARRYIAANSDIKEIKDSTANKGGVFSSSVAEVLTAFLFGNDYDAKLLNAPETRWALIREIMELIDKYVRLETDILIKLHEEDKSKVLFNLSVSTSEEILTLQADLDSKIETILKNKELVWKVMEHYIPAILIKTLGRDSIMHILDSHEIQAYRNAIITKKLASMAFYLNGMNWDAFLKNLDKNFDDTINSILA
ncbi:MAG: NADP-specific glutamate dehydrogenase GdhA [bacterium]|nr:NADP-specific glutamate dehydrogenase GdhA [bacterium]